MSEIYPDCGNCQRCNQYVMKDECMDLKMGKGYKDDFYGQVEGLRKLTGYKPTPYKCWIGDCQNNTIGNMHYCEQHKKFEKRLGNPYYHICAYRDCENDIITKEGLNQYLCPEHKKFSNRSREFIYGLE